MASSCIIKNQEVCTNLPRQNDGFSFSTSDSVQEAMNCHMVLDPLGASRPLRALVHDLLVHGHWDICTLSELWDQMQATDASKCNERT